MHPIMMVAETQVPAELQSPLWLNIVVWVCVPVAAVALMRIGRWWHSGAPLPLPLDKAWPAAPWSPTFGFALFALMVLAMQLIPFAYVEAKARGCWPWEPLDVPDMFGLGIFLGQAVPPLLGLAVLRFLVGRGAASSAGVRAGATGSGLLAGVVALAVALPLCVVALKVNTILVVFFGHAPTEHPLLVTVQEKPAAWVVAIALFQAGLMAPLAEEFIYRGVLMTTLMKTLGIGGAILASSAIFAVVHIGAQPQAVLPLFILALALGYIAYRTRSLVGPIVGHSLFNTLMVLGTFTGK
ncbi:MAG: type II CAAX endopeptidase family protein [Planctomycetota bacterium]|nr:type II CAAX endopeptidase family protein [Planctomycetota bacterium]